MKNHLILGNYNALCDSCGRKFKALDLQKRWDGLMVCKEDWEPRHPSDFLRVQKEKIAVPWSRPYPAQDNFIPQNLWVNPADILGNTEQTALDFRKVIPEQLYALVISGGFNSFSFNARELDYGDTTVPPTVAGETATVTENVLIALGRFFTDALAISEAFSVSLERPLSDAVPISDSYYLAETETSADSLSLAETNAFDVSKVLAESMSIAESLSFFIQSPTVLNGAVFNSQSLG